MAAPLLTVASSLSCPHGGTVAIASANTQVVAGTPLALATDTFTVSGCPFQIVVGVATVPHPCVMVQWLASDLKSCVNGVPTLSMNSSGLCLAADGVPQGPVVMSPAQTSAMST